MPETATIGTFLISTVTYVITLLNHTAVMKAVMNKGVVFTTGAAGVLGSAAFVASGVTCSWGLLAIGAVLSGAFMGILTIGWSGVYCKNGASTTVKYLAGGFASAFIIDIPVLLMVPLAAAVVSSLFPLASAGILLTLDPKERSWSVKPSSPAPDTIRGLKAFSYRYLGVQLSILGALCLVMFGFGYLQHLMSFSVTNANSGITIQLARGLVAVGTYLAVLFATRKSSILYRVGLLVTIAGFMAMSFLFETDLFWVAGVIAISGYTVFDVMKWVVFAQLAFAQSKNAIKTIAFMRLCDAAFYALGAGAGMLIGAFPLGVEYSAQESNIVGYFIVIAIVLLLGSEDIWSVLRNERGGGSLASQANEWGLTQRESDVLAYLAAGRTQPWIAEALHISENTVGSHVRHIYQKAGVHSRQELLDLLVSTVSPETHEGM